MEDDGTGRDERGGGFLKEHERFGLVHWGAQVWAQSISTVEALKQDIVQIVKEIVIINFTCKPLHH